MDVKISTAGIRGVINLTSLPDPKMQTLLMLCTTRVDMPFLSMNNFMVTEGSPVPIKRHKNIIFLVDGTDERHDTKIRNICYLNQMSPAMKIIFSCKELDQDMSVTTGILVSYINFHCTEEMAEEVMSATKIPQDFGAIGQVTVTEMGCRKYDHYDALRIACSINNVRVCYLKSTPDVRLLQTPSWALMNADYLTHIRSKGVMTKPLTKNETNWHRRLGYTNLVKGADGIYEMTTSDPEPEIKLLDRILSIFIGVIEMMWNKIISFFSSKKENIGKVGKQKENRRINRKNKPKQKKK